MRVLLFFCLLLLACIENDETQSTKSATYVSLVAAHISDKSFDPSTLMWYAEPAAEWEDALPIGNGRLQATGLFLVTYF